MDLIGRNWSDHNFEHKRGDERKEMVGCGIACDPSAIREN
jgi:hypothetical protein